MAKKKMTAEITDVALFNELSLLIEKSKQKAVSQARSAVTLLFWQVGTRINKEILHQKRADYGKQIISTLSIKLSEKYGRNFELRNLRRMLQFAEQFPDKKIVSPLATQLSWSHFIELLPLQTEEAKLFYAQEAIEQNFGTKELIKHIEQKDYERIQIANTQLSPVLKVPLNTFKDPYLFDFFGLKSDYLEKDLEDAILREFENFII
jgi:hypothetical protein